MKLLLVLIGMTVSLYSMAQNMPLPLTPETVGLWNFDGDDADNAYDSSPNPMSGLAFNAPLEAVPGADLAFLIGRRFSQANSLTEVGVVSGSKLDFTNDPEVSVQALIHLTGPANGTHTIFSTDNFRLLLVNNQLAGAVRQPGGLFGVVSSRTLQQNTTYRVGVHYRSPELVLSIDGRYDSRVVMSFPISAPVTAGFRATIGGNIFGEFFPGYIDDVRMENVAGMDIDAPTISMIEPSSFQVTIPKPMFRFELDDVGAGVDVSSVSIYLNGIQQTSLTITQDQIEGLMNDDLRTGVLNEVVVNVSDLVGNLTTKKFFLALQQVDTRGEYAPDAGTLALWHMNDFSSGVMEDTSSNMRNGVGNSRFVNVGQGVFSKGKVFLGTSTSLINFDGVRFGQKFTFEGWFNPGANYTADEVLFYNGQITIARYNSGYVRVVYHTTSGTRVFASPSVLLPVGELRHLAVSWNGTEREENLTFFVNGTLVAVMDAVSECDFDPIPQVGVLGQYFTGLVDEVRVSSVNRVSFNIPTLDNNDITYLTLSNGSSVTVDHPELQATLNSGSAINLATVKVRLNGVVQAGPGLVVTATGISGVMPDAVATGLNTVEIEFFDNSGDFKKKSQYFFKIKKLGLAEYISDPSTAGLWHFTQSLVDSSSNNVQTTSQYQPGSGVIGIAQRQNTSFQNVNLSCRSFTIEGQFRNTATVTSDVQLLTLTNPSNSTLVYLNPTNGNIRLQLNSNSNAINTTVNAAMPVDSAFHHVALVYDDSRAYSQLLLIVDGEVKMARDFKLNCDQGNSMVFNVGESSHLSFDELRVSRKAAYEFNLQKDGTDRPEVISFSHPSGATLGQATVAYSFTAEDATGFNLEKTKLFQNGVEVELTATGQKSRFVTTFTANLDLQLGANNLEINVVDMENNQVQLLTKLYHFVSLPALPYVADADTRFLYHFNETTGDFQDEAGLGGSISSSGWTANRPGVFGASASLNGSIGTAQISGPQNLTSYTVETWFKRSNLGSNDQLFYRTTGAFITLTSDNQVSIRFETGSQTYSFPIPVGSVDTEFHHYAVVVDTNSLGDNFFVVMDGTVIGSLKLPVATLRFNSSTAFYVGFYLSGTFDEVRFSSMARYELVSTKQ